ncbi:MAG: GTPase ObgE [Bacteroidales bacterium]|nr:GTPase ObgE [Bacteroidales bacterium]
MSNPNFVDYVKIYCKSGDGGPGSVHFKRSRNNPRGGPDGGDGGRGGHIVLKGNKHLWTLLHLKYTKHLKAENGQNGMSDLKTGANGNDIVIEVPLGTVAKSSETGNLLLEITEHEQTKILLSGGKGGLGNDHFKSATNRTPKYAQPGLKGVEGWFILELKLLADVGLVGFPNAGKSTLLSVVSAARPEIADYIFTTLTPNLGMVGYRNHQSFIMADIPGIIEGAHEGRGLGLRFLRHIERNPVLLITIPADSPDIDKEYRILIHELGAYSPELLDKSMVVAVTKSDLLDEGLIRELAAEINHLSPVFISSVTGMGLQKLKDILWNELNKP